MCQNLTGTRREQTQVHNSQRRSSINLVGPETPRTSCFNGFQADGIGKNPTNRAGRSSANQNSALRLTCSSKSVEKQTQRKKFPAGALFAQIFQENDVAMRALGVFAVFWRAQPIFAVINKKQHEVSSHGTIYPPQHNTSWNPSANNTCASTAHRLIQLSSMVKGRWREALIIVFGNLGPWKEGHCGALGSTLRGSTSSWRVVSSQFMAHSHRNERERNSYQVSLAVHSDNTASCRVESETQVECGCTTELN